jgi:glycerol transport system permease protein
MNIPLRFGWILPAAYVGFIAAPIFWLLRISLAPRPAPGAGFALLPPQVTLQNYAALFGPDGWGHAFGVGLLEAAGAALVAIIAALPAAYAFARFRFLGDRPLFFWLFAGRMLPAMALAGPIGGLYASLNLQDSPIALVLAHGLFNIGLAVWILEAALRNSLRPIDETAEMDGYVFPLFFFEILLPLIARPVAIAAVVCFVFSWTETAIATALTTSAARPLGARIVEAALLPGADMGLLAAAATLSLLPGAVLVWFMRRHISSGFAMGRP